MQDSAVQEVQEPVQEQQAPVETRSPVQKKNEPENSFVNKDDRASPTADDDENDPKTGRKKSKFVEEDYLARPLHGEGLDLALRARGIDENLLHMKKAWAENDKVKIELMNGQTLFCDRDTDGLGRISAPPGPADAGSMIAMAEIARAKGWQTVNVRGNSEEFRALSYLAITHAGLQMESPPPPAVVEQYRARFEATLKTGVDPVAQQRREEAAAQAEKEAAKKAQEKTPEGGDAKAPAKPAGDTINLTSTIRTPAPAMKP